MEGVQPVYVSPICTDSMLSEQTEGGGGTGMDKPGLVPAVIEVIGVLLPPIQDILTSPSGHNHPLVLEGHLPL